MKKRVYNAKRTRERFVFDTKLTYALTGNCISEVGTISAEYVKDTAIVCLEEKGDICYVGTCN